MEDIYTVDVGTTGLVDKELALPEGTAGTAELIADRPGNIQVATQAETRQLLVVSESYHPGWRAAVNGAPVETYRVYGDFIGCVVAPGESAVRFTFAPDSWRYGSYLPSAACWPAWPSGGPSGGCWGKGPGHRKFGLQARAALAIEGQVVWVSR